MSESRKAFENQYDSDYLGRDEDGYYKWMSTQEEWELWDSAWQASRQALEGVTGAVDGRQHIDDIAVDRFAEAMKQKLAKQRQKGYGGWNDKKLCPDGRLQKYLGAHLGKGDPVDIGNFAMMIWNRGESLGE
jgi:hypothetical protein